MRETLEQEIAAKILAQIDAQSLAKEIETKLLASEKFLDLIESRLLDRYSNNYSFEQQLRHDLTQKLSQKFIDKHADKVLAFLDPSVIANAMNFNVVKETLERLSGAPKRDER